MVVTTLSELTVSVVSLRSYEPSIHLKRYRQIAHVDALLPVFLLFCYCFNVRLIRALIAMQLATCSTSS
jgi:hypothetical protein